MPELSWSFAAVVAAAFFLAGIVKGVTGMGLPTVAIGVLSAIVTPIAAAALMIVPAFVTNVWQLAAGPRLAALLARLWPMLVAAVIGIWGGVALLAGADTRITAAALGIALMAYAAYGLIARQLSVPAAREKWLSPLIGLSSGAIAGGTGVFVIPAVPYLQALGLDKEDLTQALGISFVVATVALGLGLAWHGAFRADNVVLSTLAVAPALAGMWTGQRIRHRISPDVFRRVFLVCLFLLGLDLVARLVR